MYKVRPPHTPPALSFEFDYRLAQQCPVSGLSGAGGRRVTSQLVNLMLVAGTYLDQTSNIGRLCLALDVRGYCSRRARFTSPILRASGT